MARFTPTVKTVLICRSRVEFDRVPAHRRGRRKEKRPTLGRPAFLATLFSRQECLLDSHYFLGAIASLAAFATRNLTTVLALI
jgi:hypothetical protein